MKAVPIDLVHLGKVCPPPPFLLEEVVHIGETFLYTTLFSYVLALWIFCV